MELSARKKTVLDASQRYAKEYAQWWPKKAYFYEEHLRYLRFLIPENLRVLDLGCGFGDILAGLKPSYGVGIDFSPATVKQAQSRHTDRRLHFSVGDVENAQFMANIKGPFDIILLSDVLGVLEDCQQTLSHLKTLCHPQTRLIISYYNCAWDPILRIAEKLGQRMPQPENNNWSTTDIYNLLRLSNFRPIKREWRQLLPKYCWGLGHWVNRFIGTLPLIRLLCLRNYMVARLEDLVSTTKSASTSIIVPCQNEKGNIESIVKRIPFFCDDLEIIFVEGKSKDGTFEEIERVIKAYPHKNIAALLQEGRGKGDAVRKGFEYATKDILMILDADLTTPAEDLPKFYQALVESKGEFINGTRLVYPMEDQAMRTLNFIANKIFSWIFSYLLNQRFTDTLCGTKVLYRSHYQKIAANRDYFGDFDPFGDFDLIFGASKLNLEAVEVPVRYAARTYGNTQISRFEHGWLLLKMVVFAYRKLKAFA